MSCWLTVFVTKGVATCESTQITISTLLGKNCPVLECVVNLDLDFRLYHDKLCHVSWLCFWLKGWQLVSLCRNNQSGGGGDNCQNKYRIAALAFCFFVACSFLFVFGDSVFARQFKIRDIPADRRWKSTKLLKFWAIHLWFEFNWSTSWFLKSNLRICKFFF